MSEPQETPEAQSTRVEEPKSSNGFHGMSALTASIPLIVSIGGAVAAGLGASAVKHHQHDAETDADDEDGWLDSIRDHVGDLSGSLVENGAKIAGVAGILKAIGTRNYSGAAVLAAKALAAKRIAEYTAGKATHATAKAGRGIAHHPLLAAGGAAAAMKARRAAHEGYDRTRDAASVLRHGRSSIAPKPTGAGSAAVAGLTLLGLGAAAMYLFDQNRGAARREALRNTLTGSVDRARSAVTGEQDKS